MGPEARRGEGGGDGRRLQVTRVFGSRFHVLSLQQTWEEIEAMVRAGDRVYVVAVKDVALTMRCRHDPGLAEFYETVADRVVVDGRGLALASRLLGPSAIETVGGPDLYALALERAVTSGYRAFFVGATQVVVSRAVQRAAERHPGLRVAGINDGYFSGREEEVLARIRDAAPQLVFIGMATPMREQFMRKAVTTLPPCVCIPVGGLFDVEAGAARRAPSVIRRLGLEWLYRVIQEPRRLGPRYLRSHSEFAWLLVSGLLRRQCRAVPFRRHA